jgi:hypothetical protein
MISFFYVFTSYSLNYHVLSSSKLSAISKMLSKFFTLVLLLVALTSIQAQLYGDGLYGGGLYGSGLYRGGMYGPYGMRPYGYRPYGGMMGGGMYGQG